LGQPFLFFLFRQLLQHGFHNHPDITDNGNINPHIFANLGGVNIDMNDLGIRRKRSKVYRHPVIKTDTQGDQDITFGYSRVCIFGAMETQHSEGKGMPAGNSTQTHQSADHRGRNPLSQLGQDLRPIGGDNPAAHIYYRTPGLHNRITG